MIIYFLGQGLKPNSKKSVGNLILHNLQVPDFHTFTCFVAFASKTAIIGLTDQIIKSKEHIKNLNFFIGVDLKGTSKEALEELLHLEVNSYIHYTESRIIDTVHPSRHLYQ